MNNELFYVFVPAVSWMLFSLGGTQISTTIPGWKGWRRFILPLVYAVSCLMGGIILWRALLVAILAFGAYTLPYGDSVEWWGKFLVGCAYAIISIPIGLSFWNIAAAIGFITLFFLSNTDMARKYFVWKICEGFFGLLCGIQLTYAILK